MKSTHVHSPRPLKVHQVHPPFRVDLDLDLDFWTPDKPTPQTTQPIVAVCAPTDGCGGTIRAVPTTPGKPAPRHLRLVDALEPEPNTSAVPDALIADLWAIVADLPPLSRSEAISAHPASWVRRKAVRPADGTTGGSEGKSAGGSE